MALPQPHPADARRQSLKRDVLASRIQPMVEMRIVGDELLDPRIRSVDVFGVSRQRRPAERSDPPAEEGTDIGGHEAGKVECAVNAAAERLLADVVAVVEGGHAGVVEAQHRADMVGDGADGGGCDGVGVARPACMPLLDAPARRQIAVGRIVRRRLIGQGVGADAAPEQLGKDFGGVPQETHGEAGCGPRPKPRQAKAPRRCLAPGCRGTRSRAASRSGRADTRSRAWRRPPSSPPAAGPRPCRRVRRSGIQRPDRSPP